MEICSMGTVISCRFIISYFMLSLLLLVHSSLLSKIQMDIFCKIIQSHNLKRRFCRLLTCFSQWIKELF